MITEISLTDSFFSSGEKSKVKVKVATGRKTYLSRFLAGIDRGGILSIEESAKASTEAS